jgi:hypothetical protein
VTNDIPLGCPLSYWFTLQIASKHTLKALRWYNEAVRRAFFDKSFARSRSVIEFHAFGPLEALPCG